MLVLDRLCPHLILFPLLLLLGLALQSLLATFARGVIFICDCCRRRSVGYRRKCGIVWLRRNDILIAVVHIVTRRPAALAGKHFFVPIVHANWLNLRGALLLALSLALLLLLLSHQVLLHFYSARSALLVRCVAAGAVCRSTGAVCRSTGAATVCRGAGAATVCRGAVVLARGYGACRGSGRRDALVVDRPVVDLALVERGAELRQLLLRDVQPGRAAEHATRRAVHLVAEAQREEIHHRRLLAALGAIIPVRVALPWKAVQLIPIPFLERLARCARVGGEE